MGKGKRAKPAGAKGRGFRWSQVLLYGVALLGMSVGVVRLLWYRVIVPATTRVTGEVMSELVATDRIELEPGSLRDWNVLILTMDTTRADHLACYGNRGIETPVLDDLARNGLLCSETATPVPATLPAHSSLLTGLDPHHHGARANGTFKLEEKNVTLAEVLKEQGYRTGAAISAFVLDSQFGTDQGFESYNDDLTVGVKYSPQMFRERAAELTNVPVREWIKEHAEERFFYWVHYFDPHAVYLPPEPFRSRYAHDLYDGEIAYLDSQIGELLAYLEELGVRDHTLVIVAGDHGEGLGEHGEQTHSLLVYDSTVLVPLIWQAPGVLPGGQVLGEQVSLVDVMPTVLDMLGIEGPAGMDGRSLLREAESKDRAVYIETLATMTLHGWAPLLGVRRADYKFILAPEPEVYDLRKDPGETENLYDPESELAIGLHEELVKFVGEDPWLAATAKENLPLDLKDVRLLEALGYVGSAPEEEITSEVKDLPDPKVMVHHWEKVQQGVSKRNTGDVKGAIALLEECLKTAPRDVFALQILAGAYGTHGEYEKALETFERVVELAPGEMGAHMGIANMLLALGENERALAKAKEVREKDPENGDVYVLLGRMAYFRREVDEAMELLDKAIELDPGSAGPRAHNQRGAIHFAEARFEEARQAYRRAIEIDGLNGEAHDGLARILVQENRLEEAKRELVLALRFTPTNTRGLATLGGIFSDEGDQETAQQVLNRALEITPKLGFGLNNLGLTYRRQGKLDLAEAKYKEAMSCAPRLDLPHVNLAQLYLMQGKEAEAMDQFREAAADNRHNTIALANLGTHHLREGEPKKAQALLQRAVRVDPNYAFAHKHLGALWVTQGMTDRAEFHFERYLELDPNGADVEVVRRQLDALQEGGP